MGKVDSNGKIIIKQEGYFFSVSGNDALIFNKYLGYKIYGVNVYKTGFPVVGLDRILKIIDKFGMDYDVIDKRNNIIATKRFPFNGYEIVDEGECTLDNKIINKGNKKNKSGEKLIIQTYIKVLEGLGEGLNYFTGELINDLDTEIKSVCFELAIYFSERLKLREKNNKENPNHGKFWLKEDDELLISEYKSGKSISELSKLFKRSKGAIQSRLVRLFFNNNDIILSANENVEKEESNAEKKEENKNESKSLYVNSSKKENDNVKSCAKCRSYKNGNCFGRGPVCDEYEEMFAYSQEDIDKWPKIGDATKIRQNGIK